MEKAFTCPPKTGKYPSQTKFVKKIFKIKMAPPIKELKLVLHIYARCPKINEIIHRSIILYHPERAIRAAQLPILMPSGFRSCRSVLEHSVWEYGNT